MFFFIVLISDFRWWKRWIPWAAIGSSTIWDLLPMPFCGSLLLRFRISLIGIIFTKWLWLQPGSLISTKATTIRCHVTGVIGPEGLTWSDRLASHQALVCLFQVPYPITLYSIQPTWKININFIQTSFFANRNGPWRYLVFCYSGILFDAHARSVALWFDLLEIKWVR